MFWEYAGSPRVKLIKVLYKCLDQTEIIKSRYNYMLVVAD